MGKLSTTPDTMVVLVLRENDVISTINALPQSGVNGVYTFEVGYKVGYTTKNRKDLVQNDP